MLTKVKSRLKQWDFFYAEFLPCIFDYTAIKGGSMKIVTEMYDAVCTWLSLHPVSSGSIMAFILSVLRLYMQGERTFKTIFTESLICAFLSVGVTYLMTAGCGLSSEISVFIGSMTGYIGADNVKVLIQKIISNKLANLNVKGGKE